MEEEIIGRAVQLGRRSFILTIPQAIAREAGICKGQGVRFRVRDGEIVLGPTDIAGGGDCDGATDPTGHDKYERAMEEMMAKDKSERSGGRGAASERRKVSDTGSFWKGWKHDPLVGGTYLLEIRESPDSVVLWSVAVRIAG